jgi:hypothetical protein
MPWVTEGNVKRCTAHDCTFAKNKVCPTCTASKARTALRATKMPVPVAPKGCMSSVQLERWFVELAKKSAAAADEIAAAYPVPKPAPKEGQGPIIVVEVGADGVRAQVRSFHEDVAIAKYNDVAIKSMRAAAALCARREDDDIVERRHRELVERDQGASH